MKSCYVCGNRLSTLDIACFLKFVDRGAEVFQCRECLCKDFGWSIEYMDKLVQLYRERGCTLFPPLSENDQM